MRKPILWALAAALLTPAIAPAADLKPGSTAPAIQVAEWVKGKPVEKFDTGRIYVVEFWATWCGPCRTSIPHLTELARKNPDVPFIGVSVFEQGDDIPGQVKAFVEEMGDEMDYHVALDKGNWMADNWMRAAQQNGIPTAFIVDKQGKIAWIGHPMTMDEPLAQIKAGTFDQTAFNTAFDARMRAQNEMRELQQKLQGYVAAYESGDKAAALKGMDELIARQGAISSAAMTAKLRALSGDDAVGFEAAAKSMVEGDETSQMVLAQFTMSTAMMAANQQPTGTQRLPSALKAAQMLVDGVKDMNAIMCYYLSQTFGESGDKAKGLALAEQGIKAFDADSSMNGNAQMQGLRDALAALRDKYKG